MWADGDAGDPPTPACSAIPSIVCAPVRYLAALGGKPWCPCAWNFQRFWPEQIEFARTVGAAVGVSNGWLEYAGLAQLPSSVQRRMIRDLEIPQEFQQTSHLPLAREPEVFLEFLEDWPLAALTIASRFPSGYLCRTPGGAQFTNLNGLRGT